MGKSCNQNIYTENSDNRDGRGVQKRLISNGIVKRHRTRVGMIYINK